MHLNKTIQILLSRNVRNPDDFYVSDEYYWRDGLHLNSIGKSFLCNDIVISLETFFSPTSTCTQSTWIPSELKKLHTPKKNKKKLLPWSETDLDLVAYKKREKYGKKSETSRRRRRRKKEPKKRVNRTNDGFIYPTHSYQPPPPPQLLQFRRSIGLIDTIDVIENASN